MGDATGSITIRSLDSVATARIRADVGFNCFSFEAPTASGTIEALWSEPAFAQGTGRPSRSGIPVLFPFAGRIGHGRFTWRGRDYAISSAGTSGDHAIHGFVYTRPWRVTEQRPDSVTGVFQGSIDAPETQNDWPSDYAIELTWSVSGNELTAEATIWNPGETALPFTFGLHPYFRVPLGGNSADNCLVTVPASTVRELKDLLPTGRDLPIDPDRDLRGARRFGDLSLDDIVTDLSADADGTIATVIEDPGSGIKLIQTFSDANPFAVVFTPPHREAIAIEPYTGSPDPFAVEALGMSTNLIVLEPGERWRSDYRIRVE